MTDGLMLLFFAVIVLLGGGILFVISHGRRHGSALDVDRYRTSWLAIERQLIKGEEPSYQLAILNADKLLDQALKQKGFEGSTMGERMKSAKTVWSNANNVWTAHKIRNKIAHESDISVSYSQARGSLSAFKQALKDLGAI